ncbi:MAG: hypothetical protein OEU36_01965, partial [Gammaproteobacteria bacterium]|nr:hypothetical protein [Gammaproteobacteria bacterium]
GLLPCLALVAWVITVFPPIVVATHEVDHRYEIQGFVLDKDRKPLADEPITIRFEREVIGNARTDDKGAYGIQLHLHDADINKELKIEAVDGEYGIRVTFAPGDKVTRRVHRVDIVDGELAEETASDGKGRLPSGVYLIGAAVVLVGAASILTPLVKRRVRAQRKRKQSGSSGKGKSKR